MYRFKYTFWDENRFPGFRESISNLYDTCINHYKNTCKKKDFELKMFDTFFNDLENYFRVLITNGIVTQKNFVNILEQLKKLDLVVLLPKSKRNFYGVNFGYQIAINPEIEGMDEYSEDFMKQLVVSHELGHLINNKWVVDTKELSKRLYKDPVVSKTLKSIDAGSYKYIQAGFSLLDEVVAEEAAEEVTYFLYKKKRPKKEIRNINYNPYLTNYILYGELQDLALNFSKSIKYIKDVKNISDKEVMLKLVRRSFDDEFLIELENEILSSDIDKKIKLITMLGCMGKIKVATYDVVGLNKDKEDIDINKYVELFNSVKRR